MPFQILSIFQIFTSIIIFSLFNTGNCLNNQNYKIFTLINEKIVVISQMRIHFFNYQMDEDKTKRLVLEKPLFLESGMEKIELSQFSDQDGEYIMILINSIIYFFDKDGNRISYSYLSDSLKEYNYNLIPYKKENNYLHYLITYPAKNKKSFNIEYFKFDVNYPHSNQLLSSKSIELNQTQNENNNPINISKINCIFMSPSKLNREILVCFYAFSYIKTEIQIKSFDPLYDFNEISEFFRKYEIKEEYFEFPKYISGIANKEKNKALIYFINGYSYMMNFDFENWLSEPIKILNDKHFKNEYSQHKILYFKKSDETLVISSVKYIFCKLYVIHFNSNFDLKYKEVIDLNEQCKNLDSFSSFLDGKIYKIINENHLYYLMRLNKNKRNLNAIPEKCRTATEDSLLYNLCTSCADGYLPAETPRNITYDITYVIVILPMKAFTLMVLYLNLAMKHVKLVYKLEMILIVIALNVLIIIILTQINQKIVLLFVHLFIIIHFMGNINVLKELIAQKNPLYISLRKVNVQAIAKRKNINTNMVEFAMMIVHEEQILVMIKYVWIAQTLAA